jgi:hypothetical protein
VYWKDFFHCLQFQKKAVIDVEIQSEEFSEGETFVFNVDLELSNRRYLAQFKFPGQTILIDAFQQSRPFQTMHLDCRADDYLRPAFAVAILRSITLTDPNRFH